MKGNIRMQVEAKLLHIIEGLYQESIIPVETRRFRVIYMRNETFKLKEENIKPSISRQGPQFE